MDIKCSWDLCKYYKNGICNHVNGIEYNIQERKISYFIKEKLIETKNNNMMQCKLYTEN